MENGLIVVIFTIVNATNTNSAPTILFDKLWELGAVIIASLVGVIAGAYVSVAQDKKRRKQEIKKIRELLQKDFSGLNNLIIYDIKNIAKFSYEFEFLVEKMITREYDFTNFTGGFIAQYRFKFWDALYTSASLIKLESSEIEKFQLVHDLTIDFNQHVRQHTEEIVIPINDTISSNWSFEKKKDTLMVLKKLLIEYNEILQGFYFGIHDNLKGVNWIKLEKLDILAMKDNEYAVN